MFQVRTSCPNGNKYYIRKANGGWNGAVQGNPTKSGANVLANCVGYANGRFAEIMNEGKIKYQFICNAENFIEKAKAYGLKISDKPTLGGIMVWQKGATLSGNDGAGHVAVIERIDSANQIYTSESNYGGNAFFNATRNNNNGRWGLGVGYTFRGCIVNPAVKEEPKPQPKPTKQTYRTNYNMNIRKKPSINSEVVKVKECTDAMKKALVTKLPMKPAVVKKGTNFTALELIKDGNYTWAKNYSGYICISDGKTKYCTKVN